MKTRRMSLTAMGRALAAGLGLTALWLLLALLTACGSNGLEVTRAEYGDVWPFSVDQGTLRCETSAGGHMRSAVFQVGETEYALNAVAEIRGYTSVEPIWRNNPLFNGAKLDLAPLVGLALQQC